MRLEKYYSKSLLLKQVCYVTTCYRFYLNLLYGFSECLMGSGWKNGKDYYLPDIKGHMPLWENQVNEIVKKDDVGELQEDDLVLGGEL